MKSKLISLCQKYEHTWSHISGKLPYGSSESLEFEIELTNPDTPPVKQNQDSLTLCKHSRYKRKLMIGSEQGRPKSMTLRPLTHGCQIFMQ